MEKLTRMRFDVPEFRVLREEGSLPKLRGHAALFNVEVDFGYFREMVAPGAFKNSIESGDDVRALFNHDPNLILGRNKAGTLRLSEDEKGLLSEIDPPDTQLGRDIVVSIERGDISQMSFGFYITSEEVVRREGESTLYIIKEARLFDVSPVTYPAYESTDVEVQRHVRERLSESEAQARAEFEFRKRNLRISRTS
jgi:uncharacterized protein